MIKIGIYLCIITFFLLYLSYKNNLVLNLYLKINDHWYQSFVECSNKLLEELNFNLFDEFIEKLKSEDGEKYKDLSKEYSDFLDKKISIIKNQNLNFHEHMNSLPGQFVAIFLFDIKKIVGNKIKEIDFEKSKTLGNIDTLKLEENLFLSRLKEI